MSKLRPIPQIRLYQDWLRQHRGLAFDSYHDLWEWSVRDLDAFWQSIWDAFRLESPTPHRAVLADARMPGTVWFPGAQVNYARQVLRHVDAAHAAGLPALISRNERGEHRELAWPELRRQVASVALHLEAQGLKGRMTGVQVIFRQSPRMESRLHFGSRLVFARDGRLFITLGERFTRRDDAQTLGNHHGKVVRIEADGRVPQDNPYASRAGALPEIWSLGHRNIQGAALHPATGELWIHEHGPQGGDEVNVAEAGRNYGWPVITYGAEYVTGTKIGEGTAKAGMEQPLV